MRGNTAYRSWWMGGQNCPLISPINALIVNDSSELIAATGPGVTPPTPRQIFDTWTRFSNDDVYPGGTTPQGEAASWVYNSSSQQVESSVNSATFIGFVSPETLLNYEASVVLSSTGADDDCIFFIIAYTFVNGIQHSLVAARSNMGMGYTWALIEYTGGSSQTLVDGTTLAPLSYVNSNPEGSKGGWGQSGPTRVWTKRSGSTIEIMTSQFGASGYTLDPATKITYTIPQGSVFESACAYGFGAFSQQAATFGDIAITGGIDNFVVYDISQGGMPGLARVFVWNGSSWVIEPARDIWTDLGYTRLVTNPKTGKTFKVSGPPCVKEVKLHVPLSVVPPGIPALPPVPPALPVLSIAPMGSPYPQTEVSGSPIFFKLNLNKPWANTVTAFFSTLDGTAISGQDYVGIPFGTIDFAPGETTKLIAVEVIADDISEAAEEFTVELTGATEATINPSAKIAVGRIIDDGELAPTVAVTAMDPPRIDEGNIPVTITVSLDKAWDQTITVTYETVDGTATAGSDYVGVSGSLVFAPGETSKTVTLQILDDALVEPKEYFSFVLTSATNANLHVFFDRVVCEIYDNDTPPIQE